MDRLFVVACGAQTGQYANSYVLARQSHTYTDASHPRTTKAASVRNSWSQKLSPGGSPPIPFSRKKPPLADTCTQVRLFFAEIRMGVSELAHHMWLELSEPHDGKAGVGVLGSW